MIDITEAKEIENQKILFELEVLKARLEIRDFFLKTTVKDIYENVGQVLSIVRMQLAVLNPEIKELPVEELLTSGNLVGQSIRDLRNMSRSFYPDDDITKEEGLVAAINHTLKIFGNNCKIKEGKARIEKDINPGLKLITFKILLDVLISIHEAEGKIQSISFSEKSGNLIFAITYQDKEAPPGNEKRNNLMALSSTEAIAMINGKYSWKLTPAGNTKILFKVPCKMSLYE